MGTNIEGLRYDICIPPYSSREKEKLVHRFKNFFNLLFFRRKIEFSKQRRAWSIEFHATTVPFLSSSPVTFISPNDLHTGRNKKRDRQLWNGKREGVEGASGERERKIGNIGVFPGIKIRKLQCLNRAGFNETISRVFPTSMQLHDNGRA